MVFECVFLVQEKWELGGLIQNKREKEIKKCADKKVDSK